MSWVIPSSIIFALFVKNNGDAINIIQQINKFVKSGFVGTITITILIYAIPQEFSLFHFSYSCNIVPLFISISWVKSV